MSRPTRTPTPLEMAVHGDDPASQRISSSAFVWFLVIAVSPVAIPLAVIALSTRGWF